MEWSKVLFNGLETNIEVTRCGKVRRVKVDWMKYTTSAKIGEVDFNKLKINKGYRLITIQIKGLKQKTVRIHQLVASAFLDYKFQGHKLVVDHIDSNQLNNNLDNLRVISHRENISKEKNLKRKFPVGVYFEKSRNKYRASIFINYKQNTLGYFNTPEEASNAYQLKLKEL
jgi:hypothetical protein